MKLKTILIVAIMTLAANFSQLQISCAENLFSVDSEKEGASCFVAGTMIAVIPSQKPIESVRVGDVVYSYDEKTGKIAAGKVTSVFHHAQKSYGRLSLADGTTYGVTPEHRFYTAGQWVPAGKLGKGAMVMRLVNTGVGFALNAVAVHGFEASKDVADVYNIEVETYHNYFANGVLVHNIKGGG